MQIKLDHQLQSWTFRDINSQSLEKGDRCQMKTNTELV